jgi:cell division septal protein FtsQ
VREQVITPRAGRVGAGGKGRGAASVQRQNTRRARPATSKDSRQKSFQWKSALPYVPAVLKTVLAVALGLLAYLGYRTAVSASFFKVKAVDVAGASRASREDIRSAVMRLSNAGVWQADLEVIAKELKELPWVREAVVTRVLPDGLRVRVTEREPRVISRTGGGRLVWVDDDGVVLGTASPGDEDFFIRGIDESRTVDAAKHNSARVNVARELSREWKQMGLTKRVSELNLENLDDVRVQLAGPDAAIEVRLGKEEFGKRLRQALEVLDAQRLTPRGPYISYVDVSQGKRAIIGTTSTAQYRPEPEGDAGSAESQAPDAETQSPTVQEAPRVAPAQGVKKKNETRKPPRAEEKKTNASQPTNVATRPRRVG